MRTLALTVIALTLAACNAPTNPAFDLSLEDAKSELRDMRAEPKRPDRPVLILAGYGPMSDVGSHALRTRLEPTLRQLNNTANADTPPEPPLLITVPFGSVATFDTAADRVVQRIEQHHPSNNPNETVEVDVVAISMGGLVARYAASHDPTGQRKALNINTLYTIVTPHNGANAAFRSFPDKLVPAMHPQSDFLARLNRDTENDPFTVVSYARLNDAIVGEDNTAYNNTPPYWVSTPPFQLAHFQAQRDPRIIADIARRIRSEPHYTTTPPTPLPE